MEMPIERALGNKEFLADFLCGESGGKVFLDIIYSHNHARGVILQGNGNAIHSQKPDQILRNQIAQFKKIGLVGSPDFI